MCDVTVTVCDVTVTVCDVTVTMGGKDEEKPTRNKRTNKQARFCEILRPHLVNSRFVSNLTNL